MCVMPPIKIEGNQQAKPLRGWTVTNGVRWEAWSVVGMWGT